MLYAQAPPGLAVTAVNGLLVAAAMSLVSSAWAAWTWFGSLVLVLAARALLLVRFHRAPHLHPDAFWSSRFALGAAATGLAWGLSVVLLPSDELAYQVFLGFVISGMAAGAIPTLSPHLLAYRAYLLAALVPFGIRMAILGDQLAYTFLVIVTLFGLFMWINARRYHDTLRRSLELGRANLDLVADLTGGVRKISPKNAKDL
jgi:hypothetical protein